MNEIIKLKPIFQDYLWGGTRLRDQYGKDCNYDKVAESWELSNHPAGQSIVDSGEKKGLSFGEYLQFIGKKGLGTKVEKFENFPILIKFIDAKQSLSIQVHPSDEYALREEGEYGKTEMWYIMDCDENASLYYGVKQDITKEEFQKKIENNTLLEILNKVSVKKGDVFFIEAGTIHAIGEGILICEIQQNSNSTYRVYDFGRKDDKGNTRELHVEKALDVSKLTPSTKKPGAFEEPVKISGGTSQLLGECKYFKTKKYVVQNEVELNIDEDSFCSIIIVEGAGKVSVGDDVLEFKAGDSFFIPAAKKTALISGDCEIITTVVD